MNRKLLSTVVILLATMMAMPLAQARDGRGDSWPEPGHREPPVERHDSHPGRDHEWYKPGHYRHYRLDRRHYYHHYRTSAPHYYGPWHHRPPHYHGHHQF